MVLGREELECEICVDGELLEQVPELKYLGYVIRKVASGRKVASTFRSLVNAKSLQLMCVMVLHEGMLVSVV